MSDFGKKVTVSQYVGNFLRMELRRRGKTQEAFAEEVGVADRTVRRWCSGEIHSLEGVQEIAWALNINIRDIFSDWDDVPYPLSEKQDITRPIKNICMAVPLSVQPFY